MSTNGATPLVEVDSLVKYFPIKQGLLSREVGRVHAVDDVTFAVREGETLGLVGESGCGKTTLGRTIVRLLDPTSGDVKFRGRSIGKLGRRALRPLRREMQIVFQDPYASLNPRKRVGSIIAAPLQIHGVGDRNERRKQVQELLETVGLSPEHYNRYPHEFSGGQRQRIGVARALALRPKLIVADEPVSALDVTIQAQIIELIDKLKDDFDSAVVLITHDLGVVADIADRIAVMYAGRVVEFGAKRDLFYDPQHPYTWGLLGSIPRIDRPKASRLYSIEGMPPSLISSPQGCKFRPRCPHAFDKCIQEPELENRVQDRGHLDRCWLSVDEKRSIREQTIVGEAQEVA